MRTYPQNSPQAAARIVALAVLADGHPSKIELDVLDSLRAVEQLGLETDGLLAVIRGVCEDLLCAPTRASEATSLLSPATLAVLMAEIESPELRLRVIQLCVAAIAADKQLMHGEAQFLASAAEHWGLQHHLSAFASATPFGRNGFDHE